MHGKWLDQVELASELEWLLLCPDIKLDDLLTRLVADYGSKIFTLLKALNFDQDRLEKALVETMTLIVNQRLEFPVGMSVGVWIYSQALDIARKNQRILKLRNYWFHKKRPNNTEHYSDILDFPAWLSRLPEYFRLLVVMQRYLELGAAEISSILRISDDAVTQSLALLNHVFPYPGSMSQAFLDQIQQNNLVRSAKDNLEMQQSRGKLRRMVFEMGWVVGALLLVAVLTLQYDLRNPDLARKANEWTLPTSSAIPRLAPQPTNKLVLPAMDRLAFSETDKCFTIYDIATLSSEGTRNLIIDSSPTQGDINGIVSFDEDLAAYSRTIVMLSTLPIHPEDSVYLIQENCP